jgi:hypothetical protein
VHLPLRLATGGGERFQEKKPILRLPKNLLPPIPAAHEVIDRA